MNRVLGRAPGVVSYQLDPFSDVTYIVYDPALTTVKQIVAALAVTGHGPGEVVER